MSTSYIHKVFNNLTAMFEYRKDVEMVEHLSAFIANDLENVLRTKIVFTIDYKNKYRIVYHSGNKFKFADIRKFFDNEAQPFDNYILIIQDKMNPSNAKSIDELTIDIQVFEVRELMFNISKHILVPKHELIDNQEEIESIINKFKLKSKTHFPIILKTDPMAKYIHAQPGTLVKVTRFSPSSAEHVIYRYCV